MIEINDKFYQEENYYNEDIYKGYENDIEEYINKYLKNEYYKIIEKDKRTNIMNIFSQMRTNIIKWYPFEENKKVLEIGANYGEISQELVKRSNDVTLIEFSKTKAKCIAKRLEDSKNVKIVLCSDLKQLSLEQKYDYITLIGIAEYAKKIGFDSLKELLEWTFNHLEENGKILFAVDNKFGVKYLAGSTKNKEEVPFAIYKTHVQKDYELYGKTELENILKQCNYKNYKFYYPVPNYNLTHAIYTQTYLPKKSDYNIYYREDEEILFNELNFMYEAIKNNKFDVFTNSYLIELAKTENTYADINFVRYSNMRKKQYKIITKIGEKNVTKEAYVEEGKTHIKQVQNNIESLKKLGIVTCENSEDGKIISSYIQKPTMDEYLEELVKNYEIEKFYEEIYKWEKFLKEKFKPIEVETETILEKYNIQIAEEQKQKLTIIKDGFIDLVFQNIFYDGCDNYIVFDQEWHEENIPLEFILYRSLKQLFFKYKHLEKRIDKQDLYKKYGLEEYIDIFDEIEEKWQEEMIDKNVLEFYSEKWSRILSIEDIKYRYNQELGKVYQEKDRLQEENKNLKKENEELKLKIQEMEKDIRYKWTKFLRRKEDE